MDERATGGHASGGAATGVEPSPWRRAFPIADRSIFLDHAGVAPISEPVREAIERFAAEALRELPLRYPYWEEQAEETRRACAEMVRCDPHQLAFVKNTSEGLSLVAEGLDLGPGDAVLVADREFPSNVYPWWSLRRLGVEVRMLPVDDAGFGTDDLGRLLEEVRGRVRVVALSAVSYGTGDRLDLAACATLCREHGAFFVVDGIQAIGVVEVDVRRDGLDCVVADGHKWLCAPEGCGLLALSDRLLERLRPTQVGWKSVMDSGRYHPYDFRLRPDAARLEAGSLSFLGVQALAAAVDLVERVGLGAIEVRVSALTRAFADGLRARGYRLLGRRWRNGADERAAASGIVTFVPRAAPERLRQELWERGAVTKVRFGGIRVAPHHYQDTRDVEAFLSALDEAERALA
jgi:selenocysteine lyase/cysteine desulfurase